MARPPQTRQTDILPEGKHGLAHTLGESETLLKHMGNNNNNNTAPGPGAERSKRAPR